MTLAVPTQAQLRVQVQNVRKHYPKARFIGLRAAPTWSGPERLPVDGAEVRVVACPSPLAFRQAMQEHAAEEGPLVLLSDCPELELGLDVRARLVRPRLLDLDPWALVLDLFQARELDRRLKEQRWLAEALIEAAPADGYPPVAAGALDEATVWAQVLTRRYDFASGVPDLPSLLRWSLRPEHVERLQAADEEERRALAERLTRTAGPAAPLVLSGLADPQDIDGVAQGLALRVLTHPDRDSTPALRNATVRFEERFLGGANLDTTAAAEWAAAAEEIVRGVLDERTAATTWFERAEALLVRLGARDYAAHSPLLPAALAQRLEAWGQHLAAALEDPATAAASSELEAAATAVTEHELARRGEANDQAVRMALRLVRWLGTHSTSPAEPPSSFAGAVAAYARTGGFVDWARAQVWDEGQARSLRQAYAALIERVDAAREAEDRHFGELLADWAPLASERTEEPLPIEQVLDRIVAPLAAEAPVLLVVLDGMSHGVFRELEDDLLHRGWLSLQPTAAPTPPVVAAFPTVTEVSRTSLLCGELRQGTSTDEAKHFPTHAALKRASKPKKPPLLFHKDRLEAESGSGLGEDVHEALADLQQRVVAAVVNAVDDHLFKGDQVRVSWTVPQIRPLDALLAAARDAHRTVVITSDHGHVVDRGTRYRPFPNAAERWRPDDGQTEPKEILLRGPRLALSDTDTIRAPWSERIRYSQGKRHGYHGGASPAEVVVPVGVFATTPLPSWTERPVATPSWWDTATPTPIPAPAPPQAEPSPAADAGPLFESVVHAPAAPEPTSALSKRLRENPIWQEMEPCIPSRVDRTTVYALLDALTQTSPLTAAEASRITDVPPRNLSGLVNGISRALNFDGEVIRYDRAQQQITLNGELLAQVFEVEL